MVDVSFLLDDSSLDLGPEAIPLEILHEDAMLKMMGLFPRIMGAGHWGWGGKEGRGREPK